MNLSVIIVNYKNNNLLFNCLDSIYQWSTDGFEIIVVDNASNDNTETILKEKYPQVVFLQMGYNSGFARANNAGIRLAKGHTLLLLNSDTIILNDAINKCLNSFVHSDYVACGVQLLNEDGSPQISGNYAMTGGLNYLLPLPFLGSLLKWVAELMHINKPNVPVASDLVEVDWINGAYLMFKHSVIQKAGLMDEDFFLYAEEAEWCSRLKKHGKLCIYGEYHVTHLQGASANDVFGSGGKGYFNLYDQKGLQIMLSNFLRIRKQFGLGWFLIIFFLYMLNIFVFLGCLIIVKLLFPGKSKYSFSQWLSFSKNMTTLIAYVPKIVLRRKFFYKVL